MNISQILWQLLWVSHFVYLYTEWNLTSLKRSRNNRAAFERGTRKTRTLYDRAFLVMLVTHVPLVLGHPDASVSFLPTAGLTRDLWTMITTF